MAKTVTVSELKIDQKIAEEFFALKDIEKKISKQDKPYYNVTLSDQTGELKGKIWSEAAVRCDLSAKAGDIVCITGLITEYNGTPQITIDSMSISKDVPPEAFLPVTSRDRNMMVDDLDREIEATTNMFLRKLLKTFWDNPDYRNKFINHPAGMYVHHGYVCGLLEHVWEMHKLSQPFFELFPQIDKDLLFTGIFFHDIGKLEELGIAGANIIKTSNGALLGHIPQGLLFVDSLLKEHIPSFPSYLRDKLLHMILSHQGTLQNGSPVVPQTLEALVLSMIDDNGAKMNQATKHIEKNLPSGEDFTEYHKWLGTSLFQKDYLFKDGNIN